MRAKSSSTDILRLHEGEQINGLIYELNAFAFLTVSDVSTVIHNEICRLGPGTPLRLGRLADRKLQGNHIARFTGRRCEMIESTSLGLNTFIASTISTAWDSMHFVTTLRCRTQAFLRCRASRFLG